LLPDEKRVVTVEYTLLLSVLVLGIAAVWQALADAVQSAVSDAAQAIGGEGVPSGWARSRGLPGRVYSAVTNSLSEYLENTRI